MHEDSSLLKGVRLTESIAHYDSSAKRLLSEKIILAWILKRVIPAYRDCSPQEIAEKYIEGEPLISTAPVSPDEPWPVDFPKPQPEHSGRKRSERIQGLNTEDSHPHEKRIAFDLLFEARIPGTEEQIGIIIDVENQNGNNLPYPLIRRALYYGARLLSHQLQNTGSQNDYGSLRHVYSIWILPAPHASERNTLTTYEIARKDHLGPTEEVPFLYDLLTVAFLRLAPAEEEGQDEVLRLLAVLLSSTLSSEVRREILETQFHLRMSETLTKEESSMSSLGMAIYEKGIQEGIQIERDRAQEGIQIERNREREKIYLNQLENYTVNRHIPFKEAADLLLIPEEEHEKYRALLEQKLTPEN